jgi:uncharacterized ion transporter superfamily protein YfcC
MDIPVKRRFSFPTPYTVLVAVIALAALATYAFPSGRYDTLTYTGGAFVVASGDSTRTLPGTQATLEGLGIRARAADFAAGKFSKPVTVPGTYRRVEASPQGPLAVLMAPIKGLYEAIDVVLFVLVIGGFIGVFNRSGAFDAGLAALARRLRGREGVLVVLVIALMALGGTTFGMAEETVAFYPLLVPVFLAAGYDRLVPLAVILGGSHIGGLASTTNPFATIIASDAAGVSWTVGLVPRLVVLGIGVVLLAAYTLRYAARVRRDPSRSLAGAAEDGVPAAAETDPASAPPVTGRVRLLLALFAVTFGVMVWGVSRGGWWFPEMTALFLGAAVVVAVVQRTGERAFVGAFLDGARDLLGVAFIIGVARGVTVVLTEGGLSGTLLASASATVAGMPPVAFVLALFVFFALLAVVVPSSSGIAVLTMPIMSALGVSVGVPLSAVVSAYVYGIGLMFFVSPSGMVLPSIALAGVGYDRWLRFIGPFLAAMAAVCAAVLVFETLAG